MDDILSWVDFRQPLLGHKQPTVPVGLPVLFQFPVGDISSAVAMAVVDSHKSVS